MVLSLLSVFITAGASGSDACLVGSAMSNLSVAPTMDGKVSEEEWGKPVIVTSPDHAATTWADGYTLGTGATMDSNQRVKIYVTNDKDYLYVAATIDHTTVDNKTNVSGGDRALLAVTASKYVTGSNVVQKDNGDCFRYFRVYGDTSKGYLSRVYTNQTHAGNRTETSATYSAKFNSDTYTYELKISWKSIPGYENGFDAQSPVAMTFRVNDTAVQNKADQRGSYYRIGGDGAATFAASANPHSDGVLTLTAGEWCEVNGKVSAFPTAAPNMDTTVTEDEWGKPVIITSPVHAKKTWTNGYKTGQSATQNNEQRAKIYMTNDGEYLYIAATLDHALASKNSSAKSGYVPLLAVTVSQYVDGSVLKTNNQEQFRFFRLYLQNDGTPGILSRNYSGATNKGDVDVSADCYNAKYDDVTKTYTFVMKIAWNTIPGMSEGILNTSPIAMTLRVGDANLGTTDKHENSYYQIGGTAAGSLGQATPHASGVLKMDINPIEAETPATNHVASAGQAIAIDGQISQLEWGSAVAVMGPTSENFFNSDKDHGAADQRAKVYLSNDDQYIYVGATLDHADKGLEFTGSNAWKYPMFWFTLSTWDDDTTVKRVNGTEQYTSYRFNFADPSVCTALSKNISGNIALASEDWAVVYDPNTRTYTYEARIPLSATNICYADSLDVAFSAQIGAALYTANKENDRYNLGLAAANYPAQDYRHEGENRAVKITLNKPSWLVEGNYVKDTVAEKQGDIVIDANVTTGEWGDPVIVTGSTFAKGYWGKDGYWSNETVDPNQLAKIYMTNDANYLYIAATLDHADAHVNVNAANYGQPQMTVTLSRYVSNTNVVRVNGKEQFSAYRIGWFKGGEVKATTSGNQLSDVTLSKSDWAVRYDASDKTYVYELRIPLSTTNINLHETSQIAASIQIGDSNYGTNGDENNRYNIGGTGAARKHLAAQGVNPHAKQPALVMNLRQNYYVKDTASKGANSVAIDGKITVTEWGNPVIVANPSYTHTMIGAYREYDTKATNDKQTARVWLGNDNDYIYVGATLDRSWMETATKNKDGQDLTATMRPHFAIDLSQYDAANTFKQLDGAVEQFTGFIIWLDENGNEQIAVRTQGLESKALSAEDYAICYDNKTGMHTYEMRIPLTMTNISLETDKTIAFSASLGTNYSGKGAQANRYLFSLGCEGLSHKDQALTLKMSDLVYVKDAVSPFIGPIELDGHVSTAEWGQPIVVTNPRHCKTTWNGYWKNDAAHVINNQTVKVYSTNDDEYVYFAVTIDEADLCTLDGRMYEKAHVFLTIGRYDKKTGMERIQSQNKNYERCIIYRLGFEGSTPKVTATGIKVDRVSIGEDDWVIGYDAQARTYTYELRVPFEATTLRYGNDNKMSVSIAVADARYSMDKTSNVYNIGGTGASYASAKADNFAHTGQSMMLKLNDNPYAAEGNWSPITEINPVTGDLAVWVIVPVFAAGGIVGLYLIGKRRKLKD